MLSNLRDPWDFFIFPLNLEKVENGANFLKTTMVVGSDDTEFG